MTTYTIIYKAGNTKSSDTMAALKMQLQFQKEPK